jgi:pimeloyl-ACP methyl ester carboxylesterase
VSGLARDSVGAGIPLVCLHPFGTDRSVMKAAMEPALAGGDGPGERLRRIYPDLPGCGESAPVAATSEAVLAAVSGLLDAETGGEPALLAGWSYGGYLAAALARRQPARVAGLLLICTGVRIMPGDRDLPAGPAAAAEPGWLDGVPAGLRGYLSQALGARTAAAAARVAGVLTAAAPCDEEYLETLRSQGYRLADEDSAAGYQGPALLLAGRGDRIGGYADSFRLLGSMPEADYLVLAQAGHLLPLEQPAAFRSVTAEWLARAVPQAG